MSDFSPMNNPRDVLGMLPTTVEIFDSRDGSRKPIVARVYDDVGIYLDSRFKTREKALDAVEKAVLKVTAAKGV